MGIGLMVAVCLGFHSDIHASFATIGQNAWMTIEGLMLGAPCIALAMTLFTMGWRHRPIKSALAPTIAGGIFVPVYILFHFSFDGFALLGALASVPLVFAYAFVLFGLGRVMRWIIGWVFR
ncbi:hypothetical protein BHK69_01545 [Bosea vaviloviae]|uniref:Uncharacterized protein n=1 Tax=Bosea vaviloviae TaxID=1526658 RepID=A0A1D7TW56_9HYPH|nr:hypothetical protein BHK69_01545 [Bosea vaviloviae]